MDVSVPSLCQGCRKFYSGEFTKLERFADKWMCPSCIEVEKKKLQAPAISPEQHRSKRNGNYLEFALQHKAAFTAGSAALILLAGVLIDARIPILAAFAAVGVWIVRKAIQGSRQQETANNVEAKITACVACGETVSLNAKSCPHCGQLKPASKTSSKAIGKHLLLAFLLLMLFSFLVSMFGSNRTPSITAEEVVSRCGKEMGLDPNSSTPITMSQIRDLDACVNRYGFKTKQ